jgi:hypothetical protein
VSDLSVLVAGSDPGFIGAALGCLFTGRVAILGRAAPIDRRDRRTRPLFFKRATEFFAELRDSILLVLVGKFTSDYVPGTSRC